MIVGVLDSQLESTRIYWREKLGLSPELARDPRPYGDIVYGNGGAQYLDKKFQYEREMWLMERWLKHARYCERFPNGHPYAKGVTSETAASCRRAAADLLATYITFT